MLFAEFNFVCWSVAFAPWGWVVLVFGLLLAAALYGWGQDKMAIFVLVVTALVVGGMAYRTYLATEESPTLPDYPTSYVDWLPDQRSIARNNRPLHPGWAIEFTTDPGHKWWRELKYGHPECFSSKEPQPEVSVRFWKPDGEPPSPPYRLY